VERIPNRDPERMAHALAGWQERRTDAGVLDPYTIDFL
jgi:hypothetical protein